MTSSLRRMGRWAWLAVLPILAGCSFTNSFELPVVVGDWASQDDLTNPSQTVSRKLELSIEEDGSGSAVIPFIRTDQNGVPTADELYVSSFEAEWRFLPVEELYRLDLRCIETNEPGLATCVDEVMFCFDADGGNLLRCNVTLFGGDVFFDFLPVSE